MKIPKQIIVKGQVWNIEIVPRDQIENNDGICIFNECLIRIAKELSPKEKLRTLFHEIVHAILLRIGFFQTSLSGDLHQILAEGVGVTLYEMFQSIVFRNPIITPGKRKSRGARKK